MTSEVIIVEQTDYDSAKNLLRKVIKSPVVPKWKPELNGRWNAIKVGDRSLDTDESKMLKATLGIINDQSTVSDQREVYYRIRMEHPNWTYHAAPISTKKVYDIFVDSVMENVQLATNCTMQSLGIRAGPRGTIYGDGTLWTPRRGNVPLRVKPSLNFDLVDSEVTLSSNARKHINYEKLAGFDALVEGDISVMVEASFSTSQGYMSEAASKFLRDQENRGLKIYVLGDGDPHGAQIEMMYGRSSKASAYMPDDFYPQTTKLLGLFPSIASALNLPPEEVKESHQIIFKNLKKLADENPDYANELEILISELKQWEWQALAGLTSDPYQAYQMYLVESLRASGDEIKYVPSADELKGSIVGTIRQRIKDYVDEQISSYIDNYYNSTLKPQLTEILRNSLESQIDDFVADGEDQITKLENIDSSRLREAVKLKLVNNPVQYYDSAEYQVINDILDQKFEIEADIQTEPQIADANAEVSVNVSDPTVGADILTKNDIVEAIEKRVISYEDERKSIQTPMRTALESKFGRPDVEW